MLEICFQISPEIPLLHSRKHKLRLSEQNNKSLKFSSVQRTFSEQLLMKDNLFESSFIQGQKLFKNLI